ncbi:hypothetical protein BC567DRAFT_229081 [Phyllosticta citribraziliensis]
METASHVLWHVSPGSLVHRKGKVAARGVHIVLPFLVACSLWRLLWASRPVCAKNGHSERIR